MMRERSMRSNGIKGRVPVSAIGNSWWGLTHCGGPARRHSGVHSACYQVDELNPLLTERLDDFRTQPSQQKGVKALHMDVQLASTHRQPGNRDSRLGSQGARARTSIGAFSSHVNIDAQTTITQMHSNAKLPLKALLRHLDGKRVTRAIICNHGDAHPDSSTMSFAVPPRSL